MKIFTQFFTLGLIIFFQAASLSGIACSMCKVTINGHTYLGNNEDSWGQTSRIWFETAAAGKLGALYVGYANNFPQGGMNEAGLAFDGLTIYPKKLQSNPAKKNITNPANFIREIMQTCKTVEEVKQYAMQYNRQAFSGGELFFADKSGQYLVMEPDTIITGREDKYIIANFCPSTTADKEKLNWDRYKRGHDFLSSHMFDTSRNFSLALVDTMHECRKKLGDGTVYSFIANLQDGAFSLYFYHDYKHEVKFNLKEELAKGNHVLEMPALFSANAEYEKLKNYKTPQNSLAILTFLFLCRLLFIFSSLYFLVSFFRTGKATVNTKKSYRYTKLLLFMVSAMLLYYVIILAKNQPLFYSPAPYRDYKFSMLNIAAYIPFALLLLIIPLIGINLKLFKRAGWRPFSKWLFTINNVTYLSLIILFAYWGFYNVL